LTTPGYKATVVEDDPKEGKRCLRVSPVGGEKGAEFRGVAPGDRCEALSGQDDQIPRRVRLDDAKSGQGRAQLWFESTEHRSGWASSTIWTTAPSAAPKGYSRNYRRRRQGRRENLRGAHGVRRGDGPGSMPRRGGHRRRSCRPRRWASSDRGTRASITSSRSRGCSVTSATSTRVIRRRRPTGTDSPSAGILEAEPASDPADLARRLQALFAAVAPTVRVSPRDRPLPQCPTR